MYGEATRQSTPTRWTFWVPTNSSSSLSHFICYHYQSHLLHSSSMTIEKGYPYLSSFPRILPHASIVTSPYPSHAPAFNKRSSKSFRLFSALSATPSTGSRLTQYADVVKRCVGRKLNADDAAGFERDALMEMEETLRYVAERYEEAWS